jgi:SAM-dependent methyltransferase
MLPEGWDWAGKKVLDFGCGVGRTLSQFGAEAESAEFWGCDIHGPSVDWMRRSICPPFHIFQNGARPPLPLADGYFDLIYAWSVYTHITDDWADWLLEHRRLLADDGLLLVSFLGEGMTRPLIGEVWDDAQVGMNALRIGSSFDRGGPMVFHSPWWLTAHWGRAFEIVKLMPHTGDGTPDGHGLILLRPKRGSVTADDLREIERGEPREVTALQHHVRQLEAEALRLRALTHSRSWRITAPMRAAMELFRGRDSERP